MAGMKVSELDFLQLLPAFMRDDEAVIALSKAMDKLLGEPAKRLNTISTWGSIGELTEAECDEMAWELDVDWYDSYGMSLEQKRATLMEAQHIKRKRGTRGAVQQLITSLLGEGEIAEWYEINGKPYTFVILTTNEEITAENYAKFVETVNAAKNERSHMEGVYFYWLQGPEQGVAYDPAHVLHHYDFRKCGTYRRTAVVGIVVKSGGIETEPKEAVIPYAFPELNVGGDLATIGAPIVGTAIVGKAVLRSGSGAKNCGTYPRAAAQGAAVKASAAAAPECSHVLYVYPKCGTKVCAEEPINSTAILGSLILGEAILE